MGKADPTICLRQSALASGPNGSLIHYRFKCYSPLPVETARFKTWVARCICSARDVIAAAVRLVWVSTSSH